MLRALLRRMYAPSAPPPPSPPTMLGRIPPPLRRPPPRSVVVVYSAWRGGAPYPHLLFVNAWVPSWVPLLRLGFLPFASPFPLLRFRSGPDLGSGLGSSFLFGACFAFLFGAHHPAAARLLIHGAEGVPRCGTQRRCPRYANTHFSIFF